MPNLRSQEITAEGIALVAPDGRSFSLTRAEVVAYYQSLQGNATTRKAATVQWIIEGIEAALGAEQVPAPLVDLGFDAAQGIRNIVVRSAA